MGVAKKKTGPRAKDYATYLEKAKLHSVEVTEGPFEGCWEWVGAMANGVPRASRHPDAEARGPVNLRVALLTELRKRPKTAHNVTTSCGNQKCVNPRHLKWESKAQFRKRVAETNRQHKSRVDDDRYREAIEWTDLTVPEVAARLGVSRATLYSNWARLGLKRNVRPVP